MDLVADTYASLTGQIADLELVPVRTILYGLGVLVGLVIIFFIGRAAYRGTQYEIDGVYGGGPGLRRFFKFKKLKWKDREGHFRGKSRSFKDPELEQLLAEDKLSEAAQYLTGLLNAAKATGDKYTLKRYEKYSEEIIGRYDALEEEAHGGKAIHVKK